jgi:hypothetical protein
MARHRCDVRRIRQTTACDPIGHHGDIDLALEHGVGALILTSAEPSVDPRRFCRKLLTLVFNVRAGDRLPATQPKRSARSR